MEELQSREITTTQWFEGGDHPNRQGGFAAERSRCSILILSDIRFLREGLAEVLRRDNTFTIVGATADVDQALAVVADARPQMVLIDASLPDGLAAVARLRHTTPTPQIVALALGETEADVIAWAEAGVCGYVPRSTGLSELVSLLEGILCGEQRCSTRITAGLLRWISHAPCRAEPQVPVTESRPLTTRQVQVARLIAAGLSNKEIARELKIGVATTKSHVHDLLGKLELSRRGQLVRRMSASPMRGAPWHAQIHTRPVVGVPRR